MNRPPEHRHDSGQADVWRWPARIALFGFLAIGAFFLLTEHRAHTLGALPFVLLALCPLLHLFGHGGHGGSGKGGGHGH